MSQAWVIKILQYTNAHARKLVLAVLVGAALSGALILSNDKPGIPLDVDYQAAVRKWADTRWWSKLERGRPYCFVDPAPTNDDLREPVEHGISIIAKRRDYECPVGTTIVLKSGVQYPVTAQTFLNGSLALYLDGQFEASIELAKLALALQPSYAEAYNNICAAYNGLKNWNAAIAACTSALDLKPDFQLAKNNLAWARKMAAAK